jgi:hypothetical protein
LLSQWRQGSHIIHLAAIAAPIASDNEYYVKIFPQSNLRNNIDITLSQIFLADPPALPYAEVKFEAFE